MKVNSKTANEMNPLILFKKVTVTKIPDFRTDYVSHLRKKENNIF